MYKKNLITIWTRIIFISLVFALVQLPATHLEASDLVDDLSTNELNTSDSVTDDKKGFVYRQADKLMLEGEQFRFIGTNNYYLHYKTYKMIDDVIEGAAEMGLRVIRIWGFLDGVNNMHDGNIMQVEPGVFNESGFEKLDYTIKKAADEGIKLVIVLSNNWDEFGGMNQYVNWVDNAEGHDSFYTNEETKNLYKDYLKYIINRTNRLTAVKYKDDPTIMTWELANQPRCSSDKSGDNLIAWITEMSKYIKELDSKHLVAAGDEGFFNRDSSIYGYGGFEGVDWDRIIRIPTIDYGTYHLFPERWGWKDDILKSGLEWIKIHLEIAEEVGKPAVLDEYGVKFSPSIDRNYLYDKWNDAVYKNGGAGSMFWLLTGIDTGCGADKDGLYPDYDGFRVVKDSVTADLLSDYAKLFNADRDIQKLK